MAEHQSLIVQTWKCSCGWKGSGQPFRLATGADLPAFVVGHSSLSSLFWDKKMGIKPEICPLLTILAVSAQENLGRGTPREKRGDVTNPLSILLNPPVSPRILVSDPVTCDSRNETSSFTECKPVSVMTMDTQNRHGVHFMPVDNFSHQLSTRDFSLVFVFPWIASETCGTGTFSSFEVAEKICSMKDQTHSPPTSQNFLSSSLFVFPPIYWSYYLGRWRVKIAVICGFGLPQLSLWFEW